MKKLVALCLGASLLFNAAEHQRPTGDEPPAKRQKIKGRTRSLSQEDANLLLLKAALNGNVQLVGKVLSGQEGVCADINAATRQGVTALMLAATGGHEDVVQQLLAVSADVNAASSVGRTALMYASLFGYNSVVKTLIAMGADVNVSDRLGWTAVMLAAQSEYEDIVKLLLDNDAVPPQLIEMNRVNLSPEARQLIQRYKHLYQPYLPGTVGVGG